MLTFWNIIPAPVFFKLQVLPYFAYYNSAVAPAICIILLSICLLFVQVH